MVTEALRNYVSLAGGLVEVSRQQAVRAARALSTPGEVNQEQIGRLAEELMALSRRNRDAVVHLIAHEVERARDRLGVAPADRVETLTARIEQLEAKVAALQAQLGAASDGPATGSPSATATRSASATARDVAAKKTAAKAAGTKAQPSRTTRTSAAKTSSRRSTGGSR